jgi:hypothetical protein
MDKHKTSGCQPAAAHFRAGVPRDESPFAHLAPDRGGLFRRCRARSQLLVLPLSVLDRLTQVVALQGRAGVPTAKGARIVVLDPADSPSWQPRRLEPSRRGFGQVFGATTGARRRRPCSGCGRRSHAAATMAAVAAPRMEPITTSPG